MNIVEIEKPDYCRDTTCRHYEVDGFAVDLNDEAVGIYDPIGITLYKLHDKTVWYAVEGKDENARQIGDADWLEKLGDNVPVELRILKWIVFHRIVYMP